MNLNKEEMMVLGIFKKHNIEKKRFLPLPILHRERQRLSHDAQNNWIKNFRQLENSGYIIYDPLGYGLTDKGRTCIRRLDFS